jgi:hypothetical protein
MTESFLYEGGVLRVRWETRDDGSDGAGSFKLTVNSAVSGRELAVIAEEEGPGKGASYVAEEPRPAYLLVEAKGLTWSITVEEGHAGTTGSAAGK